MIRKGPGKATGQGFGEGRLRIARAFLTAAEDEATLAGEEDIGNPIISQAVTAAIAYADALTARFGDRVNRQDHAALTKNLRGVLGNRLPTVQASRLRRILGEKDAAQYGTRIKSRAEAERVLRDLREFASWAEAEFRRPR